MAHQTRLKDSQLQLRVALTNPRCPENNASMVNAGLLDQLKFDASGLVPLIVQDYVNDQVLMMAYMNRAALEKTLQTGKVHTYSRSRGRLALKGESSQHFQHVKSILTDCDKDVVLIKVQQDVAACHEGYRSCFFREYDAKAGEWKTIAEQAFDPDKVYSK
jgi:phosphoribosyl-AMP cyclohydrolase